MKPYGRIRKIMHMGIAKQDRVKGSLKKKGYVNWWEAEMETVVTRTEIKRRIKNSVNKDLLDL